jgi:hypothetical protein
MKKVWTMVDYSENGLLYSLSNYAIKIMDFLSKTNQE